RQGQRHTADAMFVLALDQDTTVLGLSEDDGVVRHLDAVIVVHDAAVGQAHLLQRDGDPGRCRIDFARGQDLPRSRGESGGFHAASWPAGCSSSFRRSLIWAIASTLRRCSTPNLRSTKAR